MSTTTAIFDINRMSKETGISVPQIEFSLGLLTGELPRLTFEQLKPLDNSLPMRADTREEFLAYVRWREMTLDGIRDATTSKKVQAAYFTSRSDTKECGMALNKWIELATTTEELAEIWTQRTVCEAYVDEEALFTKWKELSRIEIEAADDYNKAVRAWDNVPSGTDEAVLAAEKVADLFRKAVTVANSFKRISDLFTIAPSAEGAFLALEKWKEMSRKQIERATTLLQIELAHGNAPNGSQERVTAREKWKVIFQRDLDASTNIGDLVYGQAYKLSPKELLLANTKFRQLCLAKIAAMSTPEEGRWICQVLTHERDHGLYLQAVDKWLEIATKPEDLELLCDRSRGSEVYDRVIRKLATFYGHAA